MEYKSHFNLNPLIPFGWSHRLEQGGGWLNNNFTHKLSIVLYILNGAITAVNGETRNDMPQAPLVTGVHDWPVNLWPIFVDKAAQVIQPLKMAGFIKK